MRRKSRQRKRRRLTAKCCRSRPLASVGLSNARALLEQRLCSLEGKWVSIFPPNNARENEWKSKILLWRDLLRRLCNSSTATVWKEDNANQCVCVCVCLSTQTLTASVTIGNSTQKNVTKRLSTKTATLLAPPMASFLQSNIEDGSRRKTLNDRAGPEEMRENRSCCTCSGGSWYQFPVGELGKTWGLTQAQN